MTYPQRDTLDVLVALAQIVGALATAAAFWVTFLTLHELKRQTDLANNPLLKLRFRHIPPRNRQDSTGGLGFAGIAIAIGGSTRTSVKALRDWYEVAPSEEWRARITKNLVDQDISSLLDSDLAIEFTNVGKSEITQITFGLHLTVNMMANDFINYITPSDFMWNKMVTVDLAPNEPVNILITNTKYFPEYSCSISNLHYRDIRGRTYTNFDGISTLGPCSEEILKPRKPVQGNPTAQAAKITAPKS